jgi:MFS family permease
MAGWPLAVSALWFSFYAQWITVPVTILQSQVMRLVGRSAAETEAVTGLIIAAGAAVALVAAPLAGALSDRWRLRSLGCSDPATACFSTCWPISICSSGGTGPPDRSPG